MAINLKTPLTDDDTKKLTAGDEVCLSGTVYTARDAAHRKLVDLLAAGEELPFDVEGSVIFYVGPTPAQPGQPIGAAGPTTSYRMDPFVKPLMQAGVKGMIGKGSRSREVIEAIRDYNGVYFGATGGAGALLAETVTACEVIAFEELGAEAVRRLEVKDMPLIVINDVNGNDLYDQGVREWSQEISNPL